MDTAGTTKTMNSSCTQPGRGQGLLVAILLAVLCALAAALLPTPAAAEPLPPETAIYGIGTDNNIYSFDPTTGAVTGTTSTAPLSLSGNQANAFALDRVKAQVYFIGTDKNLYAWDRPSGWLGQVASASDLGIVAEIRPLNATFYDSKFWFIQPGDNLLRSALITYGTSGPTNGKPVGAALQPTVTISGVPGSVNTTPPGTTPGFTHPHDIVFNPITSKGYGTERDNSFFEVDLSTLSTGTVAYTQLYGNVGANSVQLAYDQDFNTLYGVSFADGQWYTLGTTLGGNATAILGAQTDIVTNPQFQMADLAGGLVPVPEPGSLAIAGSGALFVGFVIFRRGRRRGRGVATADEG